MFEGIAFGIGLIVGLVIGVSMLIVLFYSAGFMVESIKQEPGKYITTYGLTVVVLILIFLIIKEFCL